MRNKDKGTSVSRGPKVDPHKKSVEEIKPDAWKWITKGNSEQYTSLHPTESPHRRYFNKRIEPVALFSESTIKEKIEDRLEDLREEKNSITNEELIDEMMSEYFGGLTAKIEVLEDLKEVFES